VLTQDCKDAMKFPKLDLHLLVLCVSALAFFAAGSARAFHASNDFVPVYTGARCLLHGCDPYRTSKLEEQFFQSGGRAADLPSWDVDVPVYPPSTFLVLSPLALFPFPAARLIWFLLNGSLFVTATALILSLCPSSNRWLATTLGSLVLLSSGILLVLGQPAMFAISLVAIGTYLFARDRALSLGALLYALSLAVKPQIGGLIVLYLFVRRVHRHYAMIAMAGALAILLSAALILRLHPSSAQWPSTLRSNLTATLDTGGSADPRPGNQQAIGDINLQALSSIFFADGPRFNAVAYAVFLLLLACWVIAVWQTNAGPALHFVALGALAILTLTPIYHRFYDTRLLLLTIPAVLIVFQKRRILGTVISLFTVLALISVQYRVQEFLLQRAEWQSILQNKFFFILLLRQQNLELLVLFCLYLFAILSLRASSSPATGSSSVYR
jgi:Glycosyltransferase family 87